MSGAGVYRNFENLDAGNADASINVTLGCAITVWVYYHYQGVKAQGPPEVLQRYTEKVKTGLPGVAYVRLDAATPWPERLQVKLPQ